MSTDGPKFSEKYPNILSFKLFRLVFCLFRFYRNIENLCFGIEAKQPKQTFCFGQCRKQFRFQFRLFRIETSFEGHPIRNPSTRRRASVRDTSKARRKIKFKKREGTKASVHKRQKRLQKETVSSGSPEYPVKLIQIFLKICRYICKQRLITGVNDTGDK